MHGSNGLAQIMPTGQCVTKMVLRSTHGEDLKPGCSKAVPNSKKQIPPSSVCLPSVDAGATFSEWGIVGNSYGADDWFVAE